MPKLQHVKGRYSLTIPKPFVVLLGWKPGQDLVVYPLEKQKLVIEPQKKS